MNNLLSPGEIITFDCLVGISRGICLVVGVKKLEQLTHFKDSWSADITFFSAFQNKVMTLELTSLLEGVYWTRVKDHVM